MGGFYFLFTVKRCFCKLAKISFVYNALEACLFIRKKKLFKIIIEYHKLSFETTLIAVEPF